MATVIKTAKCSCGQEYIDFGDQLKSCPDCAEKGKHIAAIEQKILKQFTYMSVETALRLVLRLLAQERWGRDQEQQAAKQSDPEKFESHIPIVQQPEAGGLCNYIRKIFKRK